jgi:DnaK suppressor protein
MPPQEHANTTAPARITPAGTRGPRWRAQLEARWQAQLADVIELSLAYHGAVEAAEPAETLLRLAVAARRKLADIEEALGRLTAGTFGCCEQCGSAIPAGLLAVIPETRYCLRCDSPGTRYCPRCGTGAVLAGALAGSSPR